MRGIIQICFFVLLLSHNGLWCQTSTWSYFADSISTYSSPHSHDINYDGVLDIVIGGGKDGFDSNSGIMAINGSNGELLWKVPSRNEVFGSAVFQDVTNDGIKDVFITGREAQFYALDGSDGSLLWDFFPYGIDPADSGWYNFYNPQFIDDVDGDALMDLLVTNGGDHSAPEWETNRPPGHVMVLSSLTGEIIANVVVPDSAETYCSPIVVDLQNNGNDWVLFGTGGENLGGSFYACPLTSILGNNTNGSIVLASDLDKGYIAPASVFFNDSSQVYDFVFLSFDGRLEKINGNDFSSIWSFEHPGTESSAEPVIGNFTGDLTPDVFLTLYKGIAPSFSDFYQVMLDGSTGELKFLDSLGQLNYSSGNAIDLNNDGRDEAISSVTYNINGYYQHRIEQIDFVNNTVTPLTNLESGVNLASTPLFRDIDNDQYTELIYAYKKDSINPGATNGIYVKRVDLASIRPNAGIAWGGYLGNQNNGAYSYFPVDCGFNSVISSITTISPSCNNQSDGSILPNIFGNTGPYTYNWSDGSIESSLNDLEAGEYWIRVTNRMGCYEEREVVLSDPYIISFGAISSPTCVGGEDGNAAMSSSGCPCMFSGCTFLWENGYTTKPNDSLHSGWNSVVITHTDGCIVTDSVLIPEPPAVIVDFLVENVLCYGDLNGSIQLEMDTIFGPQNILWFNGDTTDHIEDLSAGTYTVEATDTRGCHDSLHIEVASPDSLSLDIEFTEWLCSGAADGEVSLMVSGGTPEYSYFVNGVQYQDSIIAGLSEGNYTLYVSDLNGCDQEAQANMSNLDPIVIDFDMVPASGVNTLDGIIISNVTGGLAPYSYNWSATQSDESVIVYLNPGWYSLEVTDSNNCMVSDSIYLSALNLQEDLYSHVFVYPNPTAEKLFFNSEATNIMVFSKEGKRVMSKTKGDFIDLSPLSSGIYYISLSVEGVPQVLPVIRASN